MLLPLVDLITASRLAVEEVIDRAGRGLIETILTLSAEQVAGAKTPGKASGEVRWHGRPRGRVRLADRQLRVERPRLRRETGGECVGTGSPQRLAKTAAPLEPDQLEAYKRSTMGGAGAARWTCFQGASEHPSDG